MSQFKSLKNSNCGFWIINDNWIFRQCSCPGKVIVYEKYSSNRDFVNLFGESFTEIDPDAKLAAVFNTIELKDKIDFNSLPDEFVLKVTHGSGQNIICRNKDTLNWHETIQKLNI